MRRAFSRGSLCSPCIIGVFACRLPGLRAGKMEQLSIRSHRVLLKRGAGNRDTGNEERVGSKEIGKMKNRNES